MNENGAALWEDVVRVDIHRCTGCNQTLAAVDEPIVGSVSNDSIDYYHLSHAPDALQWAHLFHSGRTKAGQN